MASTEKALSGFKKTIQHTHHFRQNGFREVAAHVKDSPIFRIQCDSTSSTEDCWSIFFAHDVNEFEISR